MRWGKPTKKDVSLLESLFDYAKREDPSITTKGQTTVEQLIKVTEKNQIIENPWLMGIIIAALFAVMIFSLWVCYGAYMADKNIPELFVATATTPLGAFAGLLVAKQ
jgi:hypothetical protein